MITNCGVIYGMYAKKAGSTLNIAPVEGQICINTIKKEIPKAIRFVEYQSDFAESRGYVIHNTRTNSRRWFPILIKQIRKEVNKQTHFMDISSALSAARNTTIQGTQADFVKEAMVTLQYYYWKNNLDALIVSSVHDEIICDMEESIAEELSVKKREILKEVGNRYLQNVTIDVESVLLPHWTK